LDTTVPILSIPELPEGTPLSMNTLKELAQRPLEPGTGPTPATLQQAKIDGVIQVDQEEGIDVSCYHL
jgi:hypothetical protein